MAEQAQPECNRLMRLYRVIAVADVETGVAGTSYIYCRDLRLPDDPTVTSNQETLRASGTENDNGDTKTGYFFRAAVSLFQAVYL